jgi:MerR family transcriptional regulator, light-induced transcriptional regulator
MQSRQLVGALIAKSSRGGLTNEHNLIAKQMRLPAEFRAGNTSRRSNHARLHEAELIECVRNRIIPQLARTHGLAKKTEPPLAGSMLPSSEALAAFADVAMHKDAAVVVAQLQALLANGVPIESIYMNWIAASARVMGCDWESDRADFSAVTNGMWKLQQALHTLSPFFLQSASPAKASRRVLLASAPGEQHTLGLFMVSEFFRRAGWDAWTELPSDYNDVIDKTRNEWFDLVGLSTGTEYKIETMTQAIAALRRASRNSEIVVMVGGPIFVSNPEIAVTVGADFTSLDAVQAVSKAETAVAARLSEQVRR